MLTQEQQEKAKEMLKTEVKAYFDVRDELGLSKEQYYELIRLDVNEWRIRARGKNLSKPHWVKDKAEELYLELKDSDEFEYPLIEIAKRLRLTQDHVVNYLRGKGYKFKVKKRPFVKPTNDKELERRICDLYDLGLGQALNLIELEYHYVNAKSVADTLRKYNRTSKAQDEEERHINSRVFDFIDTEEKAYWLGMMFTDGWISKTGLNDAGKQIGLSLEKKDKKVMEDFRAFLGAEQYGLVHRASPKKDGTMAESYQLLITSTRLHDSLVIYGITNNKSKDAAPKMQMIPKELRKHFWRGAMDGDGSLYYGHAGNLIFNFTGTNDFTYKFLGYLFYNDLIKSFPKTEAHRESKDFRGDALLSFDIGLREDVYHAIRHLYEGATIYMERKYKFLEVVKEWEGNKYVS